MVQLVCAVFLLLAAVSCEARLRSAWLPEADYEQKHERDEDTPKDLALVEEGAKVKLGLGDDDEYDWYTAPPGYDKHIRPAPADNSATEVWVNLDIRQLYKISAIDSTAELEVRLELSWTDERLKYAPTKTENKQRPKTIPAPKTWVPKMTFANQVEEPLVSAKLMQVDPDGRIRYRRRMKILCQQKFKNLEHFPFDNHKVTVALESFGFDASEVMLRPWDGKKVEFQQEKPLRKKIPDFIISGTWDLWVFELVSELKPSLNADLDCFLYANIYVSRKELMPIMEIVMPLYITVGLSCSALCYRLENLDIRSNVAIVGLFTTMMYLYVVKGMLPAISYLTWTHWYMMLSMAYTLFCIAEITVCHYLDPDGTAGEQQVEDAVNKGGRRLSRRESELAQRGMKTRSAGGKGPASGGDGRRESQPLLQFDEDASADEEGEAMMEAFKRLDHDGNGHVSIRELMRALEQNGAMAIDRSELKHMIRDAKKQRAAEGGRVDAEDEEPDSLNYRQFVWAIQNKHKYQNGEGLTAAISDAAGEKREIMGLDRSKVPALDKWCGIGLPLSFTLILLIMLCVEIPNMAYRGPPLDGK